jgi:hypothetical protein
MIIFKSHLIHMHIYNYFATQTLQFQPIYYRIKAHRFRIPLPIRFKSMGVSLTLLPGDWDWFYLWNAETILINMCYEVLIQATYRS